MNLNCCANNMSRVGYCEVCERKAEVKGKVDEIIRQIGRNTRMAIGLRQIAYSDGYRRDGCPFDVSICGKVLRSQKKLEVILENNDTYTVKFWHLPRITAKDPAPKVIAERSDVYCDQLAEVCYNLTHGL